MHQNVECGRSVADGCGAHRIVHKIFQTFSNWRYTKPTHLKLSNLVHVISTYGCLYRYHLMSAKWATTSVTILFYRIQGVFICKNMIISRRNRQMRRRFCMISLKLRWRLLFLLQIIKYRNHGKFGITVKVIWKILF